MSPKSAGRRVYVVLGNQLFARAHLDGYRDCTFYLAEDVGLCTFVRHHKQKIAFFLAAMRAYAEGLREQDYDVIYRRLDERGDSESSYEDNLAAYLDERKDVVGLVMWEIEDRFFEERMSAFADERGLTLEWRQSPMFLTPRETFAEFAKGTKRLQMASFYSKQRKRLDVLMDGDEPRGGQWSFDQDNREKIPTDVAIVATSPSPADDHVETVAPLVEERFADHPGRLDLSEWWLPTTRRQALAWLRAFLRDRFVDFGPYEDALTVRQKGAHLFLWHSALSPMMNVGLITPDEIVERALEAAEEHDVPIHSLEGFIRQVIGWREFIRGVYQTHGEQQERDNFFEHQRHLAPCWWEGNTGIPPLDDMIDRLQRYGWAHHIERLMVAGCLMLLCEVEPRQAYRWFMEMFVDSSDWVMVPNVYGMALFSDGGVFATKPYICGSNYILKMSDYQKPRKKDPRPAYLEGLPGNPGWTEVWDGLYWRFIERRRSFFESQPRLARVVGNLDRMSEERRSTIFPAAEAFIEHATTDA